LDVLKQARQVPEIASDEIGNREEVRQGAVGASSVAMLGTRFVATPAGKRLENGMFAQRGPMEVKFLVLGYSGQSPYFAHAAKRRVQDTRLTHRILRPVLPL